jgi:hypothetical protein
MDTVTCPCKSISTAVDVATAMVGDQARVFTATDGADVLPVLPLTLDSLAAPCQRSSCRVRGRCGRAMVASVDNVRISQSD